MVEIDPGGSITTGLADNFIAVLFICMLLGVGWFILQEYLKLRSR